MNEKMDKEWYSIDNIDAIDTPALIIYPERVKKNIETLLSMIDDVERLRPHVKTHKTIEATKMLLEAGVKKFKCATIAEAEMLAMSGAADILLAYQPSLPKLLRYIGLIKQYPAMVFECLVDNAASAKMISDEVLKHNIKLRLFVDVNVGMNRTGIEPGEAAIDLYRYCNELPGVVPVGLHVYDGHIRASDLVKRTMECNSAFMPVKRMQEQLAGGDFPEPIIIAGGSPTFPVHANRKAIECSPGTFIFWDQGYLTNLPEQQFLPAALVISRVISKPALGKICLDLGHKSVAAENELNHRAYFLDAPDLKFSGQSEEHLVADVDDDKEYNMGDVLYGLPYHICPTVALYERGLTVEDGKVSGEWKIVARDRKINI